MKVLFFCLSVALPILSTVSSVPKGDACHDPLKEYRTCQSSSCVKTCENPNPKVCTFDCRRGCFCKKPLVLDRIANRCVEIEHCPTLKNRKAELCGANEEHKKCGYCDSTCKGKPAMCTRDCRAGCYCKEDFVRHEGACIAKCPTKS